LVVLQSPLALGPGHHVRPQPHTTLSKISHGSGEVWEVGELIDALARDSQQISDLLRAHEVHLSIIDRPD
jgi:hypothetical protein